MPHTSDDYLVIRLSFQTAVRFGDGRSANGLDSANAVLPSDSLYAALMSITVQQDGIEELGRIKQQIEDDQLLLSSLLPYYIKDIPKDESETYIYCLPRPFIPGGQNQRRETESSSVKKDLKKIPYIPIDKFFSYLNFIESGDGDLHSFSVPPNQKGVPVSYDRVSIRDEESPQPYTISAYRYQEGQTGLYFVAYAPSTVDREWLQRTLDELSVTGIGGKTSSGMGKFTFEIFSLNTDKSTKALGYLLSNTDADYYMSLGSIIPANQQDIETLRSSNSYYLLETRDGYSTSPNFVSDTGNLSLKRKRCVLLRMGSCFSKQLKGRIVDLSYGQHHPVYRVGKSIQIGF